jgi:hypothetical protein
MRRLKEHESDELDEDDDGQNDDDEREGSSRDESYDEESDDYMSGWNERLKEKELQSETKKGMKKENENQEQGNGADSVVGDEGEEEMAKEGEGAADLIGDDPEHDYLATHEFVAPLISVERVGFPLQRRNAKNAVLLQICMEIWGRDWSEVVSAVFRSLLRKIRSDLPEPILKNTETQFANYLTETDDAILGAAGWAQNTVSFWKSKANSVQSKDFYFKYIADITFRLLSSPTGSCEIERSFAVLDSLYPAGRTRKSIPSIFYSIQLLDV